MSEDEKYFAILNVGYAKESLLSREELFDTDLQDGVLDKMIWGFGETEEEALQDAIECLKEDAVLTIYPVEDYVYEFACKKGGREALRHMWFDYDHRKIFLLPGHDTLEHFCDKYNLP